VTTALPYRDPSLPIETRVDDLLDRMTLEEKLAQLACTWSTQLVENDAFSERRAERHLRNGIGEVTRIGASTGLRPHESAAFANDIQRYCVERTRLGIPAIVHEESTAGLCARDATQFPQAIGLAATWNPALIEQVGEVIRRQMVAVGARHTLAPVLDVARDPRWGRVEETYGESAYLAGRLGVAYVRGVQGHDPRHGVACTGKHFLGYGLSEGGMNHAPVHLGPRELREVFAEPFRCAIDEAGLATIMNAYNSIDGLPCGASKAILTDLLRGELGFTGAVVADYFTTGLLISHHATAADEGEAGQRALEAGLDMELPALHCYGTPLIERVADGRLDVAIVDRSVRRVLWLKFTLGLFERPFVDADAASTVYNTVDDRALARRLATQAIVLLENDGVLPLPVRGPIAVVGPAAGDVRLLQGDYSYPAHVEIVYKTLDGGESSILPASGGAFEPGPYYPSSVTPIEGVRALVGNDVEVRYAAGGTVHAASDEEIAVAVAAATGCAAAIVVIGGKSGLLADCTTGEFRDATDLAITGRQSELVAAVRATGTPTVVVVMSGRVHTLDDVEANANALVWCAPLGEEGGTALAEVLFGREPPTGRLPISFPRHVGQIPVHHDHRSGGGRSQMLGDYTDRPTSPRWPFGFGRSYTSVRYSDLVVDAGDVVAPTRVRTTVTNTGPNATTETVQIYGRDVVARVARPVRQLIGFVRVGLEPGEQRTIEFIIDPTQFAYYDESMHLVVEPGEVEFGVGPDVSELQTMVVTLSGEEREIAPNDRRPTEARFA
jgi:beta-glucosidase